MVLNDPEKLRNDSTASNRVHLTQELPPLTKESSAADVNLSVSPSTVHDIQPGSEEADKFNLDDKIGELIDKKKKSKKRTQ